MDIYLDTLVDFSVGSWSWNYNWMLSLFHYFPSCWRCNWKTLGAGSGICSKARDLTCLWRVAATVACLTGTSAWIILMQSAASMVTFISLSRLLKLTWIFPSVWTCAPMADYLAQLIKTWDKPFWHAWPVCFCLMHVFCRHCVNWTKNKHTFQLINGCFLNILAQFSLYTSTFRGAALPGN